MDGSLTGLINGSLLPYNELLPPDNCSIYETSSTSINSSLCDGSIDFARIRIYDISPSSLDTRTIYLTNEFGTESISYETFTVNGPNGYIALITKGYQYFIEWENGDHLSNISYYLTISGLYEN